MGPNLRFAMNEVYSQSKKHQLKKAFVEQHTQPFATYIVHSLYQIVVLPILVVSTWNKTDSIEALLVYCMYKTALCLCDVDKHKAKAHDSESALCGALLKYIARH